MNLHIPPSSSSSCEMGSQRRGFRLLLGVTGSVAAIKLNQILEGLLDSCGEHETSVDLEVKILATNGGLRFISPELNCSVYTDEDEWKNWKKIKDPIMHIELRNWADAFVIAPLDANTLAKIANGICDNFLTCVARAWDFKKPFVVFLAMNTMMWEHPITAIHLEVLKSWNIQVHHPICKTLACGEVGIGGMLEVPELVASVLKLIN